MPRYYVSKDVTDDGRNSTVIVEGQSYIQCGGNGGYYSVEYYTAYLDFDIQAPYGMRAATCVLHIYKTNTSSSNLKFYVHLSDQRISNKSRGYYTASSGEADASSAGWKSLSISMDKDFESFIGMNVSSREDDERAPTDVFNFSSKEGSYPAYIDVEYEYYTPDKAISIEPRDEYIQANQVVRFNWNHVISKGYPQTGFRFEWRRAGGTWNVVNQTTSNQYYDMPVNTMTSGSIEWRVKTYNGTAESPYSDILTFYAIGAAEVPSLSISEGIRPMLTWSSSEQKAWEMEIRDSNNNVVIKTPNMASTFSYRLQEFLKDGDYVARLRIKNQFDLWSEWAEVSFNITNVPPQKEAVTAVIDNISVTIRTPPGSADKLVYRSEDGQEPVLFYRGADRWITDRTQASGKKYSYFLRKTTDEGYADSDPMDMECSFKGAYIASPDFSHYLHLRFKSGITPTRTENISRKATVRELEGRSSPVQDIFEMRHYNIADQYVIKQGDADTLRKILDSGIVHYRDDSGVSMYAYCNTVTLKCINYGPLKGYEVSLSLTKVDYKEEVTIDA